MIRKLLSKDALWRRTDIQSYEYTEWLNQRLTIAILFVSTLLVATIILAIYLHWRTK